MNTILLHSKPLSYRKTFASFIIEWLKIELTVKPLQRKYGSGHFTSEMNHFRLLPPATAGYQFARLLDDTGLKPIPEHESHDLWHIITGYGMSSEDEIAMQAFMYGNGSRSIHCKLFILSGIILPSCWQNFYNAYKRGKNSESILGLNIVACCHETVAELKKKIAG